MGVVDRLRGTAEVVGHAIHRGARLAVGDTRHETLPAVRTTPPPPSADEPPAADRGATVAGTAPETHPSVDAGTVIDKASWLKVWLNVEGQGVVTDDFEARAIAAVRAVIDRAAAEHPDGLSFTIMRIEPTTDEPDDDALQHA